MSVFKFEGSENVQEGGRTPRFEEGETQATIQEMKLISSKDPAKQGQVFCVVECVDSKGEVRSLSFRVNPDPYKYGLRDAKSVVAAALGIPFGQVSDTHLNNAASPAQTLRGKQITVRGSKMTKKNGESFLKYTFEGSEPFAEESVPEVPEVAEQTFPPEGWKAHPKKGYYYRGKEVIKESELRSRMG